MLNIHTELQYGLYEQPEVSKLDPLLDLLRDNPFHDSFWDQSEQIDEEDFLTE